MKHCFLFRLNDDVYSRPFNHSSSFSYIASTSATRSVTNPTIDYIAAGCCCCSCSCSTTVCSGSRVYGGNWTTNVINRKYWNKRQNVHERVITVYSWIVECCANFLAGWKSSNGCYRTILAAVATATCGHTAAVVERCWRLGKTSYRRQFCHSAGRRYHLNQ